MKTDDHSRFSECDRRNAEESESEKTQARHGSRPGAAWADVTFRIGLIGKLLGRDVKVI